MDVVASQKGVYGKLRERGEPFTLGSKKDFSTRWMVEASSKEGKALLREAANARRGITDDQIDGEIAEATGRTKTLTKELTAKDAEIATLQARLEALEGSSEPEPASEPEPEPEQDAEEAPKPRTTRRRRA